MYTWMDATLRELTELIQEVQPAARRQQARLEFALVYPDRRGRNVLREARPWALQTLLVPGHQRSVLVLSFCFLQTFGKKRSKQQPLLLVDVTFR